MIAEIGSFRIRSIGVVKEKLRKAMAKVFHKTAASLKKIVIALGFY